MLRAPAPARERQALPGEVRGALEVGDEAVRDREPIAVRGVTEAARAVGRAEEVAQRAPAAGQIAGRVRGGGEVPVVERPRRLEPRGAGEVDARAGRIAARVEARAEARVHVRIVAGEPRAVLEQRL